MELKYKVIFFSVMSIMSITIKASDDFSDIQNVENFDTEEENDSTTSGLLGFHNHEDDEVDYLPVGGMATGEYANTGGEVCPGGCKPKK